MASARAATREKDWPEAVARWKLLLDRLEDLASPIVYEQLAQAYRRTGDLDAAELTLAAGSARHRDHLGIAMQQARLSTQANDWPTAIERWQAVLRDRGAEAPPVAYEYLGRAHRRNGELDAAARVLEEGLSRHPDEIRIGIEHARLATTRRDWTESLRRWESVWAQAADDAPAEVFEKLAKAHRRLGSFDEAGRVLAKGRALRPRDLDLAVEEAKLSMEQRNWPQAIARWNAMFDLFAGPPPPEIYRRISRCHIHQGTFGEASAIVDQGLAAHPHDPHLALERVYVAIHQSRWEEVRGHWNRVLAEHGDRIPPGGFLRLAREFVRTLAHDLADDVVAAGLDRHPDSLALQRQYVRNMLGRERTEGDPTAWDWSEALVRSRTALQRQPELRTEDGYFDLAYELSESAALPEAVELLEDGLRHHSTSPRLLSERATLLLATGAWSEAVDALRTLQELVPHGERADLHVRASRALRCLGDYEQAHQQLDEAEDAGLSPLRARAEVAAIAAAAGDVPAAMDTWISLLESFPEQAPPTIYRQLAIAYHRAGDVQGETQIVEQANARGITLESNPGVVAIVGGGTSLQGVDLTPLRGTVHTVAVNATASALPWSDVAVTHDASHLAERFQEYPGPVVAGVPLAYLRKSGRNPSIEYRRRLVTDRLSELDDLLHSGGHTSAHTALNYAYLLRPRLIVLFGVDLLSFWGPDEYWHQRMDEYNRRRFQTLQQRAGFDEYHEYRSRKIQSAPAVFSTVAPQLEQAGIEVLNASPISSIECFPKLSPEDAIARCLEPGPD